MRRRMKYALASLGALTLAPALLLGTEWGSGQLAFADTGALTFEAELPATYPQADCPAGIPSSVECFTRTGSGIIRGLGHAIETYPYFVENAPAGCGADQVRVLPLRSVSVSRGRGRSSSVGGAGVFSRVSHLLQCEERRRSPSRAARAGTPAHPAGHDHSCV